jgi:hypothetical protein
VGELGIGGVSGGDQSLKESDCLRISRSFAVRSQGWIYRNFCIMSLALLSLLFRGFCADCGGSDVTEDPPFGVS